MRSKATASQGVGLLLALAASVSTAAPTPERVWIGNGEGTGGLVVSASARAFRERDVNLLQNGGASSAEDDKYVRFLRSYYEIGSRGDRDQVAKLFAPHMRAAILSRYKTPDSLRAEFTSLKSAHLKGELYWGNFALAYVEHELKSGSSPGPLVWIHTILCSGAECVITDNQEVTQLGGIVLALYLAGGKPPKPTAQASNTRLVLVAPMRETEPKTFDAPIIVELLAGDETITRQTSQLVARLTEVLEGQRQETANKSPSTANGKALPELYAREMPSHVNVFEPPDQVAMFTFSAFQSWYLRNAPWRVRRVYSLAPDLALGVLGSVPNGATELMLFRKTGSGWRIESDPMHFRTWALLASVSSYRALARIQ